MAGQDKALPGSMGLYGERKYLGKGGFPINVLTTDQYSDGAVGTLNPPPKPGGNPMIDPATGLPYPGLSG